MISLGFSKNYTDNHTYATISSVLESDLKYLKAANIIGRILIDK